MRVFISTLVSVLAVSISYYIALEWIEEIKAVFGVFTWVILIGMVFIPCFAMFYVATSLLFSDEDVKIVENYPNVSILIAAYNEEDTIRRTIRSVREQDYKGLIEIIVSDDGSKDRTANIAAREECIILSSEVNRGKSNALNKALDYASFDIIITVDADTTLHDKAIENIVTKFLSDDYSAVAGAIRVKNRNVNLMTRVQYWDYMLGIASVKQAQGKYDSTLVAQGAFSCYKKEVCYWADTVGEDIVLSWDILKGNGKIGHAKNAIAFTNVPEQYGQFFKQRSRWSRGLIEAFKRNYSLLFKKGQGLPFFWYNLFFPYIDIAYMFFFLPSVLAAVFFKQYLMAGVLTLLLIPLGLIIGYITFFIQNKVNKEVGLSFNKDILGFFTFMFFYQAIQSPATLHGYIKEILGLKKSWGTK